MTHIQFYTSIAIVVFIVGLMIAVETQRRAGEFITHADAGYALFIVTLAAICWIISIPAALAYGVAKLFQKAVNAYVTINRSEK